MQVYSLRKNGVLKDQKRVAVYFDKDVDKVNGPSRDRVKPEFYKETQISSIIERATRTGIMSVKPNPGFGVVSGADFLSMQNAVIDVQKYFDSLPSKVRDFFVNSPKNYLDWIVNPANKEQAIEMGLLEKPAGAPVEPAPAVAPPAPVVPPAPAAPVV